jgi:hypothetical protein
MEQMLNITTITKKQTEIFVCLIFSLSAICFFLYYLTFFTWQVSSDDAFNFVNAIERFSVLEFRPHFPGYPAFIGAIHLFTWFFESHLTALIVYTSFSTLSMTLLCAYLVYLVTKKVPLSLLVTACCLLNPLLLGLALSGLSDAPALMLLVAGVLFAYKKQPFLMGWAIALMLATRPSYLPLALSFVLFLPLFENKKRAVFLTLIPILVIGLFSFLFLFSKDGISYFSEGLRFTQGHFLIWGNTAIEQTQAPIIIWFEHIIEFMGMQGGVLLLSTLLLSLFDKNYFIKALAMCTVIYFSYILVAQNPDNIRHFAPVFYLFLVLFFAQLNNLKPLVLRSMLVALLLFATFSVYPQAYKQQDPTNQAISYLQHQASLHTGSMPLLLATNYSVHWMTQQLKQFSVLDSYYASSEIRIKKTSAWRLSGSPLSADYYQLVKIFYKRLPTERTLYLYRLFDNGLK